MIVDWEKLSEPKEIPLVCSYCKCDIHKGDKVAIVRDGEIINVFEGGSWELGEDWDTTKLFHAVCDWMKKKENGEDESV